MKSCGLLTGVLCGLLSVQMLSMGKKGLMIIRTDYFIDAVERGDMPKVEEFLKKDIEINRLHSMHGVYVFAFVLVSRFVVMLTLTKALLLCD
jgi:hypothetical protein